MAERKPNGYWKDLTNVVEETRRVVEKEGFEYLPSHSTLIKLGYSYLAAAIQDQGGYRRFREILGEDQCEKPKGYWKDEKHVLELLRKIMDDNCMETIPGQFTLSKLGHSNLAHAISAYHGGFRQLRKKFGENKIIADSGTWKDFDYAKSRAFEVLEKYNLTELPGCSKLSKMGHGDLARAIERHYGMREFRKRLGHKQIATEAGTWTLNHTLEKAREVLDELETDRLPCTQVLTRKGYSDLTSGIDRNGGMRKIRKLLGQEQVRERTEKLKDIDYVKKRLNELIKEHNWSTIPSNDVLRKVGESGLVSAIARYHGGTYKLRDIMGLSQIQKPLSYWLDENNLISEAKKIMKEENLFEFPSSRKLVRLGYRSFSAAVAKYQGGIPAFRKKLAEYLDRPTADKQLESMLENYAGGKN